MALHARTKLTHSRLYPFNPLRCALQYPEIQDALSELLVSRKASPNIQSLSPHLFGLEGCIASFGALQIIIRQKYNHR